MAACSKSENFKEKGSLKTVNFTAQSLDTKTVFGEKAGNSYPTLWTPGVVKISLGFDSPKDAVVTPSPDQTTSSFSASFTTQNSGPYTFYSLSPKSAYVNKSDFHKSYTINIPADQRPTPASVDEAAQILWAKSASMPEFPSNIAFNYSHVTAYGKMDLVNLDLGGRTISSISLEASKNWAGRYYLYMENNGENQAGTLKEASALLGYLCGSVQKPRI